jgi:hypothetical protein
MAKMPMPWSPPRRKAGKATVGGVLFEIVPAVAITGFERLLGSVGANALSPSAAKLAQREPFEWKRNDRAAGQEEGTG